MSGGAYCQFRVGGTGRSSSHMMYISRESAVLDQEKDVVMRNLPEDVKEARDYKELRTNLASYAWAREESEQARYKETGAGKVRTHYRCTVSFEKEIEPEKAKQMVNEWLEKEFSQAKAVAFIHRDSDHQHAHIWIDARKTDGKKIDLAPKQYRRLDESWNKIYSREMGRDDREHLEKKEQTRQHKTAYVRGEKSDKPERVYKNNREVYQEREQRNVGVKNGYEKGRDGRSQPDITARNKEVKEQEPRVREGARSIGSQTIERRGDERETGQYTKDGQGGNRASQQELQKQEPGKREDGRGEQEISRYDKEGKRAGEQFDRTESKVRTTVRETEDLRDELKGLGKELSKEIDRDEDKHRCR